MHSLRVTCNSKMVCRRGKWSEIWNSGTFIIDTHIGGTFDLLLLNLSWESFTTFVSKFSKIGWFETPGFENEMDLNLELLRSFSAVVSKFVWWYIYSMLILSDVLKQNVIFSELALAIVFHYMEPYG